MPEIQANPLTWPHGWPRTKPRERRQGQFSQRDNNWSTGKITIAQALRRVREELDKMGVDVDDVIVSSDLRVKRDGMPYSGQRDPDDPGVAVWFERDSAQQVIAIDTYTRIEQNIAAVAATVSALRALERHGGQLLNRAFTGFAALPDPESAGGESWETVLGVPPGCTDVDKIKAAYRHLRAKHHPDRGGDAAKFRAVSKAYQQAMRGL